MTNFADAMKTFSNEVFTAKCDRSESVLDLREQTERILAGCRTFMRQVAEEHQAMATRCRADLSAHRKMRSEQLRAFRDRVRRERQEECQRLQQLLNQTRSGRQKEVRDLLQGFETAMHQFRSDFRAGHQSWRDMLHRRTPQEAHGGN